MENNKKICKNKKCMKPLPNGYRHRYCESCRNCHIQGGKKILNGIVKTGGSVVFVAMGAALYNKKKPKE